MEWASRVLNAAARAASSDAVINVFLLGSFAALTVRSMNQQKEIEALAVEKDLLTRANKAMKKAMWDWKQQLYAEAASDSAIVPLARLKSIYGEASAAPIGNSEKEDAKSTHSKFVV